MIVFLCDLENWLFICKSTEGRWYDLLLFFLILFLDSKKDEKSEKILEKLETIDDDCDRHGIILVKLDNSEEAGQYGIEEIPSLVYFEETIPHLFEGTFWLKNLKMAGAVLHISNHGWSFLFNICKCSTFF